MDVPLPLPILLLPTEGKMPYYKIKNMPGFDGLIARASPGTDLLPFIVYDKDEPKDVLRVEEIINPNVAIGDSTLRWPQESDAMFIGVNHLERVDFTPREFSAENPFGKLTYECHYSRDSIRIDYASYELGLAVTITDAGVEPVKTLYAQNFFGMHAEDAEMSIDRAIKNEERIEDLIFVLNDLARDERR